MLSLAPLAVRAGDETLAVALRANLDFHGISTGTRQHKLALYAEDLLLYITDPNTSLFIIVERFKKLSNFKVNYSKTEALNLTYDETLVQHLMNAFPMMNALNGKTRLLNI